MCMLGYWRVYSSMVFPSVLEGFPCISCVFVFLSIQHGERSIMSIIGIILAENQSSGNAWSVFLCCKRVNFIVCVLPSSIDLLVCCRSCRHRSEIVMQELLASICCCDAGTNLLSEIQHPSWCCQVWSFVDLITQPNGGSFLVVWVGLLVQQACGGQLFRSVLCILLVVDICSCF